MSIRKLGYIGFLGVLGMVSSLLGFFSSWGPLHPQLFLCTPLLLFFLFFLVPQKRPPKKVVGMRVISRALLIIIAGWLLYLSFAGSDAYSIYVYGQRVDHYIMIALAGIALLVEVYSFFAYQKAGFSIKKPVIRFVAFMVLIGVSIFPFIFISFQEMCPPTKEAQIVSSIAEARTVMALVYQKNNDYDNFNCTDTKQMRKLCAHIDSQFNRSGKDTKNPPLLVIKKRKSQSLDGREPIITKNTSANSKAACIYAPLNKEGAKWYCADSKGHALYTSIDPGGGYCIDAERAICPPSQEKQSTTLQKPRKIISHLKERLNSELSNYQGFYQKKYKVESWAGGISPGATFYTEKAHISIKVNGGEVVDYSKQYSKSGSPIDNTSYQSHYNKSTNKLCFNGTIKEVPCNPIELKPPKITSSTQGCRVKLDEDSTAYCVKEENDKLTHAIRYRLGLKYLRPIPDSQLKFIESYASFKPRQAHPFCYYLAKDKSGKLWALKCANKEVVISPGFGQQYECRQHNNTCNCSLEDPKKVEDSCIQKAPNNLDSNIKKKISHYLNNIKISNISNIREKHDQSGYCYFFSLKDLKHKFCFNKQNLLTFARWGTNLDEGHKGTHIDIKEVDKVQNIPKQKGNTPLPMKNSSDKVKTSPEKVRDKSKTKKEGEILSLKLTWPIEGNFITSVEKGNEICKNYFGSQYKWAEFHDEHQWRIHKELDHGEPGQRAWVWIDDQDAECFSGDKNYGLTFYVKEDISTCTSNKGLSKNKYTTNRKGCNAYHGDTSCASKRPLLCLKKETSIKKQKEIQGEKGELPLTKFVERAKEIINKTIEQIEKVLMAFKSTNQKSATKRSKIIKDITTARTIMALSYQKNNDYDNFNCADTQEMRELCARINAQFDREKNKREPVIAKNTNANSKNACIYAPLNLK